MTTLTYTYSSIGRERIEYACGHGTTTMRGLELFVTPEPFTALVIRHRSRFGCTCEPERVVKHWPDARIALVLYETMADDVPADVDELDLAVVSAALVDLRSEVPCRAGCALSWSTLAEVGRITWQFSHDGDCPEAQRRARSGERPPYSQVRRSSGPVQ